MALNYLSGRVSRFGVGVPGFSTDRELVLDVAGALGIGTTLPRAEIDTPNISIRGDIVDASEFTGVVGYFLTQDAEGVKWIAADPGDLTTVRIFENDVVVPPGSPFTGLNFRSPDPFFLDIKQNIGDPNLADINFDVRWIKEGFGDNFGISTGFGPDGTYASIPGFGTSEAVGVTSVGIGTNQPQDDFQVGIGSTGVTINGPEGRLEAQTIKAKNVEIDGNITVESLVVDPGIATFRGNIDAQGISSFTGDVTIGVASIANGFINDGGVGVLTVGVATIGLGQTTDPALEIVGVSTFDGLVTTRYDLYVGNDLYVAGEQFIEQLNANNVLVTGIATINQTEIAGAAITSLAVSGFTTLTDFRAQSGFVTTFSAETIDAGIGTFTTVDTDEALIGVATVGVASVTTIEVGDATIGVATIGVATDQPALDVIGENTFTGFTTFVGDVSVSGILTVGTRFDVPSIGVEYLTVSGIATIAEVQFDVGIGSTLRAQEVISGLGSFGLVETDDIVAAAGTIGGVGFDSGRVEADDIDADFGRIGILTGDLISYGIGTISSFTAAEAGITTLTGDNLTFFDNSFINGVGFSTDLVTVSQNLEVQGLTTFRGVGTFGTDLYVGNDLYVAGDTFFEQINAVNLDVTGIGTINDLRFNVGFGSTATFLEMEVGVGTITEFDSEVGFVSFFQADRLSVQDPADPFPAGVYPEIPTVGTGYFTQVIAQQSTINRDLVVGRDLTVLDDTSTRDLNVSRDAYIEDLTFNVGVGTDLELETLRVGVATIEVVDIEEVDIERADVGIATVNDLTVTGIATFEGPVFIDDTIFINQEVTGVSTVNRLEFNVGVGTELTVGFASVGVATIGLASVTNLEVTDAEVFQSRIGVATVGFASVGVGTEDGGLFVVGVNTFIGFTTFTGDVFIDGGLTVTGPATYAQLDAQQSQIGILTVFERLDSQGEADFQMVSIANTFISSGVSTIGLSTFSPDGDLAINRNLIVGGITTFIGEVRIDDTIFINQEVTGVSTVNQLDFNIGVGTVLSLDDLRFNVGFGTTLTLSGLASLSNVDVYGNAYFDNDIIVNNRARIQELDVLGLSSLPFAEIGIASVGFSTTKEAFIGILTTGTLSVESLVVDPGISTFNGSVDINADLSVSGVTTTGDLNVTGIATIGILTAPVAFIDSLDYGDAIGGITSTGYLTVGTGSTTDPALSLTGVSTFVGLTTFVGDVFVDGNFFITGISSFTTIGADFGLIGILTASNFLDANDVNVSGFTSLTDFGFNVGVGSTLSLVDANVSGILSTNNLNITEDLRVGRNLEVLGISTLGAPGPAGFTTTLGDLYVGGDLFVKDDIFYDEISGRNLDISGVGTIVTLKYGVGIGTTAFIDELNFNVGVGTSLRLETSEIGVATVGFSSLRDVNVGGGLTVTGISSFEGRVTINPELFVDGDVIVSGITTLNDLVVDELEALTGLITNFTADNIDTRYINSEFAEVGFATITSIVSNFVDVTSGVVTTTTLNVLDSATIAGLTSTGDLTVERDAFVGGLTSTSELQVAVDARITGDLTVGGEAFLNQVSISTAIVVDAEIDKLEVITSAEFNGITTFTNGVDVLVLPLYAEDLVAGTGVVTSISGEDFTYDTGTIPGDLQVGSIGVDTSISVASTVTTNDLEVSNLTDTFFLNVGGIATVGVLTVTGNAYIENLNFNSGVGTSLTLETANVEQVSIGTITADSIGVGSAIVGILTVTQQIDHEFDATTTAAAKANTVDATPTTIFTLPTGYTSAEFTVTGVQGTDFISSKIHALNTGSSVFFNEYSFLSSGPDFSSFDVVSAGGGMELQVTVANGIPAQFSIHTVAHKA